VGETEALSNEIWHWASSDPCCCSKSCQLFTPNGFKVKVVSARAMEFRVDDLRKGIIKMDHDHDLTCSSSAGGRPSGHLPSGQSAGCGQLCKGTLKMGISVRLGWE